MNKTGIRRSRQTTRSETSFVSLSLLLIFVLTLIFQKASAVGVTKYDPTPHVVFFIHGLVGNNTTFGDLPKILERDFKKHRDIKTVQLYYPSNPNDGNGAEINKFEPFDFAKIINTLMIHYLVEANLKSKKQTGLSASTFLDANLVGLNSQISFVVHSQGGNVALRYLNSCFRMHRQKKYCKYNEGINLLRRAGWFDASRRPGWLKGNFPSLEELLANIEYKQNANSPGNIHNLITLGTPFWGSGVANQFGDVDWLISRIGMPKSQLTNLSIGSQSNSWARSLMLNRYGQDKEENWSESTQWHSRYPYTLNVYNISGLISAPSPLHKPREISHTDKFFAQLISWALQPKKFENDIVVSVPEAFIDFNYYIENQNPTKSPLRGRTQLARRFYPTSLSHLPIPGLETTPIAIVRAGTEKDHLVYVLIKKIFEYTFKLDLSNPDLRINLTRAEKEKFLVPEIQNFTSEIKLVTPPEFFRQFGVLERNVQITPANPNAFQTVKLGRTLYTRSSGQNNIGVRAKDNYYQTYYHVGRFKKEHAFKPHERDFDQEIDVRGTYKLNYIIRILGFEPKSFSVEVFPGMSSYSEVYLTPYRPIQPAQQVDGDGNVMLSKLSETKTSAQVLVLTTDSKLKQIEYSKSRVNIGRVSDCSVGLLGRKTPLPFKIGNTEYKDYASWLSKAMNLQFFYSDFESKSTIGSDMLFRCLQSKGVTIDFGSPLEVLSRVKKEVKTPDGRVVTLDRYLVSSKVIRECDKIVRSTPASFSNIGTGHLGFMGVRWVNVADVDMLTHLPSSDFDNNYGVDEFYHSEPKCIKDELGKVYPSRDYFINLHYQD